MTVTGPSFIALQVRDVAASAPGPCSTTSPRRARPSTVADPHRYAAPVHDRA